LESAAWSAGRLILNNGQAVPLGPSQLTWRKRDSIPATKGQAVVVDLPVYLNADRSEVLFGVELETDGQSQGVMAQRGACLTLA
jgi:dynein heavy chain 1